MAVTQPIRNKQEIRALTSYYLDKGELRNYALIVLGLYTALRVSDLLRLSWSDVYDFDNTRVRPAFSLIEKKTQKAKTVALNKAAVDALSLYAIRYAQKGCFLFENRRTGKAISRVHAYRLIRAASDSLKLTCRVSCHSLRKTFGYHAWKDGTSPIVLMEIYNHSSLGVTKRYLGITQDDKNEVYLSLDFAA